MKRTIWLMAVVLTVASAAARERTERDIKSIAAQVLSDRHSGLQRHAPARIESGALKVLFADRALTVVGSDGKGFVVVANDDVFQPVVGYSETAFDTTGNDNLSWFLSAASQSMQAVLADGKAQRAPIVPGTAPVEPFVTSTWNQDKPFNNLCPKAAGGKDYPCGCVATALGQIMNYHKYPTQGSGVKQYSFSPSEGVGELLSANFGETTYDWSHILDNYPKDGYTEEEANAVATLILHCGVAVEMQYTLSGSGAYSSEARNGLIKYFGYHANLGQFYRDYYSQEAWMQLIFDELNRQRPIYYAGADESRGGHAFVLDGYDANGLVHVNWGWGPNGGNGYYDIALLNPTGYSFSVSQDMILGIARPTEEVEYQSHIVSNSPFSAQVTTISGNYYLTGVSVGSTMWNLCGEAWEGKLGIVLQNAEHTYELQKRTVSKTANLYNVLDNLNSNFAAAIKIPANVADGEYRLFVGSKDDRDNNWQLVRRSEEQVNSYIITVSEGIPSLQSHKDDQWATAIMAHEADLEHSPIRYFDLQGREVTSDTKGLLIRRQGNSVKKVMR